MDPFSVLQLYVCASNFAGILPALSSISSKQSAQWSIATEKLYMNSMASGKNQSSNNIWSLCHSYYPTEKLFFVVLLLVCQVVHILSLLECDDHVHRFCLAMS
jgi:hypothetical protein